MNIEIVAQMPSHARIARLMIYQANKVHRMYEYSHCFPQPHWLVIPAYVDDPLSVRGLMIVTFVAFARTDSYCCVDCLMIVVARADDFCCKGG